MTEESELKGEVITHQPESTRPALLPVTQAPLFPPPHITEVIPDVIVKATSRPGVGAEVPHVSNNGAVGSGGSDDNNDNNTQVHEIQPKKN